MASMPNRWSPDLYSLLAVSIYENNAIRFPVAINLLLYTSISSDFPLQCREIPIYLFIFLCLSQSQMFRVSIAVSFAVITKGTAHRLLSADAWYIHIGFGGIVCFPIYIRSHLIVGHENFLFIDYNTFLLVQKQAFEAALVFACSISMGSFEYWSIPGARLYK